MIEYAQIILPAVIRLDRELFRKELLKCVNWMENHQEYTTLMDWCYQEFGETYGEDLNSVFFSSAIAV